MKKNGKTTRREFLKSSAWASLGAVWAATRGIVSETDESAPRAEPGECLAESGEIKVVTRSPYPSSPYFLDGGVSIRYPTEQYAVWADESRDILPSLAYYSECRCDECEQSRKALSETLSGARAEWEGEGIIPPESYPLPLKGCDCDECTRKRTIWGI
jgi:hypothetical protein